MPTTISNSQGPLSLVLRDGAARGVLQDHIDLLDQLNLVLMQHADDLAVLKQKQAEQAGQAARTAATAAGSASGGSSGPSPVSFDGDLAGNNSRQAVIGWRGKPLDQATMANPQDGQVPQYDGANAIWVATDQPPIIEIHSEPLTDGAGNFIFTGGPVGFDDIVVVERYA